MSASPARRAAAEVLSDVESRGALLAERLAQADVEALETRERAFLHELALGSLRLRGALDYALASLVARPLDELDAPTRLVLRLGTYELLHMRVPARAAVSQAVELAHERAPRARGLVNAVLRRLAREGPRPAPDPAREPLAWLTSAGSLPNWLAERWLNQLGASNALARARALLLPPARTLRLNPRHADAAERLHACGVTLRAATVPGAFTFADGDPGALARAGVCYVQDEGSQLVAHLAAGGGQPLLDACAAPGGKTALAADLLGDGALVVAADAAPRRLSRLARLLQRWGARDVRVLGADGRRPALRGSFQSVLVDAPCSGLGTLARHPDLRWRARAVDLERHARRQGELLAALAPLVAPQGRLVYAVCSLEPEESEDVARAFQAAQPAFAPEERLPDWTAPFREGAVLRVRPERDGTDGFFAAVWRRDGSRPGGRL